MLARLWQLLRDKERTEQLKDEAAIEKALLEHERRDGMSEADKLPPPFKNTELDVGWPVIQHAPAPGSSAPRPLPPSRQH